MTKKAIFAGTFNPPTLGHLDIIQRASHLCEHLYVVVFDNPSKEKPLFTNEERCRLLKKIVKKISNVEVIPFSGLLVDCAKKLKADFLVRGLRNSTDFDYESQMAVSNQVMSGVETVFLLSSPQYMHINAMLIREIARLGRRLNGFVPVEIEETIFNKLQGL